MEGHLGLGIPLGHADYYPNSGRAQPGCPLKWTYAYEEIECDHARSVNFFAESIVSPIAFPSCQCDNWDHYVKGECPCEPEDIVFMGEHSSHNVRGKFYLFTRDKKPYGLGSQMNISLPDIDQYDPDFNNTGYHHHLRPFSLKREPPPHLDNISSLLLPPIKNTSNSNQLYSTLLPQRTSATQLYWEPLPTFVIKAESKDEYPSDVGSSVHSIRGHSNYLKRHSSYLKTSSPTGDDNTPSKTPLLRLTKKQPFQNVDTPLLGKLKRQPYTRFSTQLAYEYIHGTNAIK